MENPGKSNTGNADFRTAQISSGDQIPGPGSL